MKDNKKGIILSIAIFSLIIIIGILLFIRHSSSVDHETESTPSEEAIDKNWQLANDVHTPTLSHTQSTEDKQEMETFSKQYNDQIQSPSVADIAKSYAKDHQSPEDSLDDLMVDLPTIDTNDDHYILVNKLNPLKTEPNVTLTSTANGEQYAADIKSEVDQLVSDAQSAGYSLVFISGHRTIAYQKQNRENGYQSYLAAGYSIEEAEQLTDTYYAPAEASEHSTGLALDLLDSQWMQQGGSLNEDYASHPSAQWLADHAADYGFILRYPKGKEKITGYSFEPWHFRYVGKDVAKYIHRHHLTFEEFLALANYKNKLHNQ